MAVIKRSHLILIAGLLICLMLVVPVQGATYLSAYDGYKVLSMHMNGTNGGTIFTDDTGKVITNVGSLTTNTSYKQLGSASLFSNGTIGAYLSTPDDGSFDLNTGDFTISFWAMRPTLGTQYVIRADDFSTPNSWAVAYVSTGMLWNVRSGSALAVPTTAINTWEQFMIVGNATNVTIYKNGGSPVTGLRQNLVCSLAALTIGRNDADTLVGNLDELNIWKGVAIPISELYPQYWEVGQTIPPPVASFTTNTTSGVSPLAVQFTDTSTNTPTSWSWKRSNLTWSVGEEFSTDENPVQSFVTGNWSINLTATNAAGSDLSDQTTWINVTAPPPPPRSLIQTITHDFGSEITYALVTLTKPGEVFSVSNLTSTTFDLTITNAVSGLAGTNQTVYWCVG